MAESKLDVWNQALSRIGHNRYVTSEEENTPAAKTARLHWGRVLRYALETHYWQFARREATLVPVGVQAATETAIAAQTVFLFSFGFASQSQIEVSLDGTVQDASAYTVTDGQAAGTGSYITFASAPGAGVVVKIEVTTTREGWDYLYSVPADMVRPVALVWAGVRYDVTAEASRVQYALMPADDKTSLLLGSNQAASGVKLEYVAFVDHVPMWTSSFQDVIIWLLASEFAAALGKKTREGDRCLAYARQALSRARCEDMNSRQSRDPQSPSLTARGIGDSNSDWPPYRRPV